jgi:hypothetical protein
MEAAGIGVAVLAIIGVFFLPIISITLIVWLIVRFKIKANMTRERLQADLYAKAIEKGMELPQFPPSFFTQENVEKKRRNSLNIGIICVAIGLGTSLFFIVIALLGEKEAVNGAVFGIIPFFIGIAYLLIWFIERKQAAKQDVE